jgi:hypothetical protein
VEAVLEIKKKNLCKTFFDCCAQKAPTKKCAQNSEPASRLPAVGQTRAALGRHLPNVLAGCVVQHVVAKDRTWEQVAHCGDWETLIEPPKCRYAANRALLGACRGGHTRMAMKLLALLPGERLDRASAFAGASRAEGPRLPVCSGHAWCSIAIGL